jgi:hypothetical protein
MLFSLVGVKNRLHLKETKISLPLIISFNKQTFSSEVIIVVVAGLELGQF